LFYNRALPTRSHIDC